MYVDRPPSWIADPEVPEGAEAVAPEGEMGPRCTPDQQPLIIAGGRMVGPIGRGSEDKAEKDQGSPDPDRNQPQGQRYPSATRLAKPEAREEEEGHPINPFGDKSQNG